MTRLFPAVALAVAVGSAGSAQAQDARAMFASLPAHATAQARAPIDLTMPHTPRAESFAQANALRAAGVARTALDHRFARGRRTRCGGGTGRQGHRTHAVPSASMLSIGAMKPRTAAAARSGSRLAMASTMARCAASSGSGRLVPMLLAIVSLM